MATETETPTEAVVEAAKASNDAAAETVKTAKKTTARQAKKARKSPRKPVRAQRRAKPQAAKNTERNDEMNFQPKNAFAGFGAFPTAPGFEKLFGDATGRTEEFATRSRKVAEELADITRGNVDAFVEAGRIATDGSQSIAQSVLAKGRDNVETAATTVRSMVEAKNPADLLQLQAEFVRGAFDRFVEESSSLTESMVKLAGEAFQPISNRTNANVERINDLVA